MRGKVNSKHLNNRLVKDMVFVLCTIALVLCLAFFISGTVQSQKDGGVTVDEDAYQVLEEQYVEEIRDYLEEQGFRNSGVTLTRTVEKDGERVYEVALHHKNLYKLSDKEQEALFQIIEEKSFNVMGCEFQVGLL